MKHLLVFLIVTLFSIGFGLLGGLGFARLLELQPWIHTLSQFFTLSIFLLLAHKAGWLPLAVDFFRQGGGAQPVGNTYLRVPVLIVLGILLGILVRAGIQGFGLWAFKLIDAELYTAESRELVSLWRSSATPTIERLVAIAIAATREEVMYRAVMLGAMAHYFGWVRALAFSSVIFASIHLNPITLLYGLSFGFVYLISRSILLVSVMHSVANAWHFFVLDIFGFAFEAASATDILDSQYGTYLSGSAVFLLGTIAIVVAKGPPDGPWWSKPELEMQSRSVSEKRVEAQEDSSNTERQDRPQ